jgi:hypothetical protein
MLNLQLGRKVFIIRMLRIIFGPKRDEVMGGWRKLHDGELCDLYSLPSIIRMIKSRRMRCKGHWAWMSENRDAQRLLVGKPEGMRPLQTPRWMWVDNIKIDLGEIGWGGVDWIGLTQDRNKWKALVNVVMNYTTRGPSSSAKLHRVS